MPLEITAIPVDDENSDQAQFGFSLDACKEDGREYSEWDLAFQRVGLESVNRFAAQPRSNIVK